MILRILPSRRQDWLGPPPAWMARSNSSSRIVLVRSSSRCRLRAALYLRVSTAKQAEQDVSIPDQQRQGEAYCRARKYDLVETYVEPGGGFTVPASIMR